jgi:hypothetical protein
MQPKKTAPTDSSSSPSKDKESTEDNSKFLEEQIAKAKAAGWDCLYSPSKRYLFIYNAEENLVRELMWRIEAIRDHYEKLYPPEKKISTVSIVRVCKNINDYHAYGGPSGTGGYWSDANQELVFFDNKERDRNDTYITLCHEGFHQYIYYFYGNLAPHSWYGEGHGDYFGGAELMKSGSSGRVVKIDWNQDRRAGIKDAIQKGTYVPLKEIFQYTQRQYYDQSKRRICYAEGWSIVFFLREGSKRVRMDPKWEEILPSYLKNLQAEFEKSKSGAGSFLPMNDAIHEATFTSTFRDWTDKDWQAFEEAWKSYPW